jgi:hypothetical protein
MAYETANDLGGGVTNEMVVNLVRSRFEDSADFHAKLFSKVKQWYNLYRCIYTGERPQFKNVVMLPLLLSACWSDVANKVAISLSNQRIIECGPVHPDAGPSAKRAEALYNEQLLDMNILEKMIDFLMSADVYGTGILRYGWRTEQIPYTYRQNILGIEVPRQENVTVFDGPDISVIDILDWLPQPGKKDYTWACHRFYQDLDDLNEEAYIARQEGKPPKYDPAQLAKLKDMPPSDMVMREEQERRNIWRSYTQYQTLRQERHAKPVELIDMIGIVPATHAPDGVRLRIMTMANRQIALRSIPLPYYQLRKCFRHYSPMPDMHYLHGIGKIEPVASLASSANKLVSNRLDVLDLVLQPAMFASDTTELDTQNLVLWPGRVIKVHGETGEQAIRPIQFDLQAYPMVVNETEAIARYVDMATGVQRDTIQGLMGGDRQTAREFVGRLEQARTRLGLEAKLFERQVIEALVGDIRALDQQYLTMPRQVSLIGSAALMDPDRGLTLQPDQMVSLSDINLNHNIRAIGASNMLSQTMQRQDMMTALGAMRGDPVAMQITNWVAFYSKFWRAFGFDPQEMLVSGVIPQMNEMAAQQAAGGGEGTVGPTGDTLEQLAGVGPNVQTPAQIPPMSMMGFGNQPNTAL